MQDPAIFSQLKPQFPDQEHLKCPRCDSANTKFCYYNNYNLSQPRHFCKNCRRYWTKGGALRNIPVGGGTRKSAKRAKRSTTPTSATTTTTTTSVSPPPPPPTVSASPPPLVPAAPLVMSSPTTSTTPPVAVQVEAKGEPFAASMPPAFDNYGSILSSGEGQYGHFYDGSNLQLYGFGENESADPGAGQPGNGDNINSEGFLNGHHQSNNAEAGIWNGTNGWPDLAIYTPGSNFQ